MPRIRRRRHGNARWTASSPRRIFGERWGRHWLDVVRYGESFTLRGLILREAWRYRDHVIAAFNEDRPMTGFCRSRSPAT